jgi:hypothetical protein
VLNLRVKPSKLSHVRRDVHGLQKPRIVVATTRRSLVLKNTCGIALKRAKASHNLAQILCGMRLVGTLTKAINLSLYETQELSKVSHNTLTGGCDASLCLILGARILNRVDGYLVNGDGGRIGNSHRGGSGSGHLYRGSRYILSASLTSRLLYNGGRRSRGRNRTRLSILGNNILGIGSLGLAGHFYIFRDCL